MSWEVHDAGHTFPTVCRITSENTCQPILETCGSDPLKVATLAAAAPQMAEILRVFADGPYGDTLANACDAAGALLARIQGES